MDTIKIIIALLLIAGSAFAGSYRVHYNVCRSGRDITVQAESSAEARRTLMDLIPGAVVTGVQWSYWDCQSGRSKCFQEFSR